MVSVIIKNEARRQAESQVMRSFGVDPRRATRDQRDYAACAASEIARANRDFDRKADR